jgi:ribosomal protein S21
MAIYAVKKGMESNERLMNRFKKQVQEARFLKALRERLRFRSIHTKRQIRLRALKREEFRARNRRQKFYSNM